MQGARGVLTRRGYVELLDFMFMNNMFINNLFINYVGAVVHHNIDDHVTC